MPPVKLTTENTEDFMKANKDAFLVLIFDAEYTQENDNVQAAFEALSTADEIKDKAVLGLVDVETNDKLATEFDVVTVPMVVCVKRGRMVRKIDSLNKVSLVNMIKDELKKLALLSGDLDEETASPKNRLNEYLKLLTNKAPVMVFMKGEPSAPKCGFTKQLVELLRQHEIQYESFDILQDEEVRQGLKEYSDWPTYPQVYHKGQFIGGLDIIKQIEKSGELQSLKV